MDRRNPDSSRRGARSPAARVLTTLALVASSIAVLVGGMAAPAHTETRCGVWHNIGHAESNRNLRVGDDGAFVHANGDRSVDPVEPAVPALPGRGLECQPLAHPLEPGREVLDGAGPERLGVLVPVDRVRTR